MLFFQHVFKRFFHLNVQNKGIATELNYSGVFMVESYLYNENGTDFNMRNGSFFYSMECYLCILVVKKSALFCLIFPITSRF